MAGPAIVVDCGSGVTKVGLAGEDQPMAAFPTVIGRPRPGGKQRGILVGHAALRKRGTSQLCHPIEGGCVARWQDMEVLWSHIFEGELHVEAAERAMLLGESPLTSRADRERTADILFEKLGLGALHIASQAVLSLHASGRTTGIVLDSGDGVTHAMPFYDGYALTHATLKLDLAGRDLTNYLTKLLSQTGFNCNTSTEKDIVRDIKETLCYVALDPDEELRVSSEAVSYALPDGQEVQVGPERFRCPEVLFHPHLLGKDVDGIHQTLNKSILSCDTVIRRALYENIMLFGGNNTMAGMAPRMTKELTGLATCTPKVEAGRKQYSVWVGGSILASLPTFPDLLVSKQEYEEAGPRVLHK